MKLSDLRKVFSDPYLLEILSKDVTNPSDVRVEQVTQNILAAPDSLTGYIDELAVDHGLECDRIIKYLIPGLQAAINSNIAFEKWRSRVDQVQQVFQDRIEEKRNSPEAIDLRNAALAAKAQEWKTVGTSLAIASKELPTIFAPTPKNIKELYRKRMERVAEHAKFHKAPLESDLLEWHTSGLDEAKGAFETHFSKLQTLTCKIQEIASSLESPNADSRLLVLEFLDTLRSCQKNPAYRLLCIDEEHPLIRYIHHMAFAITCRPNLLEVYKKYHQVSTSAVTLHEAILDLTHPMLNAGIEKLFSIPHEKADPEKENNCGFIAKEMLNQGKSSLTLTRLIGPAKAMNGSLDPIFELVLQAIENRRFQSVSNDLDPYDGFILTNMQQMSKVAERPDCIALMKSAERYPFSISAITVASHNGKEESTSIPIQEYEQVLTSDSNFSIKENSGNYYFPSRDKASWQEALSRINRLALELVNSLFIEDQKKKENAFYQLVKLGIVRFHELKASKELAPKNEKHLLTLVVCKSGVDRANHSNAALLWALGSKEDAKEAAELFIGRATLAHGRLPFLEHRHRLINLSEVVLQENVNAYLNQITMLFT